MAISPAPADDGDARPQSTAEAEANSRIRLERDLHDGALQRLLSLQLALAGLRRRAPTVELGAELAVLEQQARQVGDDLRRLAHGIYPGTLLERGLRQALREATVVAPVRVEGEVGRLPAHVEHAVYFSVLEAVQNALRHAGPGARVDVTLLRRPGALEFSVTDDGVGFDATAVRDCGIGMVSMRDRIAAVGGSLDVSSEPGRGSEIRGTVPL
jgi:signal transduction histidine kinase